MMSLFLWLKGGNSLRIRRGWKYVPVSMVTGALQKTLSYNDHELRLVQFQDPLTGD